MLYLKRFSLASEDDEVDFMLSGASIQLDMACYSHLEEKGVLTKKFKTPFRKREDWKFDLESFK